MIKLEALNAKHGDALLLRYTSGSKSRFWIIDGGPAGTWKNYLRPRLEELRGNSKTLLVDVAMLSHVDDDHVNGMIQMTKSLADNTANAPTFLDIRRFWHNSFTDLVGSDAEANRGMSTLAGAFASAQSAMAAGRQTLSVASIELKDRREIAVLASIQQGRDLRDYIKVLQLAGNEPFGSTLSSKLKKAKIDEAAVTMIGPIHSRLEAFRKEWKKAVGKPAALASLFREDLDESPTNLSSIVMLVEIKDKKLLLTGDARGDDIVEGFSDNKLGKKLPMLIDILKMPHHGSDRNITEKFLRNFPAKHYIISADGKYGNPDPDTIKAIVDVRGSDRYVLHFTNTVKKFPQLLKKLAKSRNFDFVFRREGDLSIVVEI